MLDILFDSLSIAFQILVGPSIRKEICKTSPYNIKARFQAAYLCCVLLNVQR